MSTSWERAAANDGALAVLLLDVDHFKGINDNYGHEFGDRILGAIGQAMAAELQGLGFAARLGGDEFVACTPCMDLESVRALADRLRVRIEVATQADTGVQAKVSVGVASCASRQTSPADLLRAADKSLYCAKRGGGGQIFIDSPRSCSPEAFINFPAQKRGSQRAGQ